LTQSSCIVSPGQCFVDSTEILDALLLSLRVPQASYCPFLDWDCWIYPLEFKATDLIS